jgi:hypothetical protein
MTRKHFIELADVIRDANKNQFPQDGPPIFGYNAIQNLAHFCARQNPCFDRERWLGYIAGTNGKNGGKVK